MQFVAPVHIAPAGYLTLEPKPDLNVCVPGTHPHAASRPVRHFSPLTLAPLGRVWMRFSAILAAVVALLVVLLYVGRRVRAPQRFAASQ